VLLIKFNCLGVVGDSRLEVAQFTEGEAPVVVEVSLAWFYLDSGCEAFDSLLVVASPVE